MLKLHKDLPKAKPPLTADSLRLAASDGCGTGNTPEPVAVSRRPMALPDALVNELCGLTEDEIRASGTQVLRPQGRHTVIRNG
jgi:hypothetical protein